MNSENLARLLMLLKIYSDLRRRPPPGSSLVVTHFAAVFRDADEEVSEAAREIRDLPKVNAP